MSTPRHQAREAALRSLYFWEIGQTDPARALETYFEVHQPDASEAVREFAHTLVLGTNRELFWYASNTFLKMPKPLVTV